jgi:hypothetical protein
LDWIHGGLTEDDYHFPCVRWQAGNLPNRQNGGNHLKPLPAAKISAGGPFDRMPFPAFDFSEFA